MVNIWGLITSKVGAMAGAVVAFLGLLGVAYLKGRNRERDRTNAKTAETVIEISKETRKNAKVVNDKSDGSSVKRLRERFNRDRS